LLVLLGLLKDQLIAPVALVNQAEALFAVQKGILNG
jgi:hypothetical protein